ncbi:Proteasome subunit beta type-4 [Perkinsus olseni]|uniref:Proteasome subunit beta type-4 n=1 Tax=Perkinsus olseni TaxID=32597 RepID=A0A7J6U888_PEROL|nr:Proteasome subunit beta type-4 [Perkinsus olseni]KAF4752957.1 Proteasome subunit beta type-4 [Perkinsus olseni]
MQSVFATEGGQLKVDIVEPDLSYNVWRFSSEEQLSSQSGVTRSSVLAAKYQDGIMMCYDTLARNGSSPRLTGVDRVIKSTLAVLSSDLAESRHGFLVDGALGEYYYILEWAQYISRICYQKWGELDPLCNNFVLGGINKKRTEEPHYLATLDHHGTLFEEDVVATGDLYAGAWRAYRQLCSMGLRIERQYRPKRVCLGSGEQLALPIMRSRHRNDMTEAEARDMLEECKVAC